MHTQTDRQTDRHTHTHTHGCTYTHTDSGKYSLVVFCKRPPSEARYLDGATCEPIYKATLRLPRYIPIIAFPQYESESTANFTDPKVQESSESSSCDDSSSSSTTDSERMFNQCM